MNILQPASAALSSELIARFKNIVGDKYAVTDAADIAPYLTEERDLFHGRSPLVLRPGSTAEVAASTPDTARGPNASSASPGSTLRASSRTSVRGA